MSNPLTPQKPKHFAIAANLPSELILHIGKCLWYNRKPSATNRNCSKLASSSCRQYLLLANRDRTILSVCRSWRRVLYAEYARFVLASCRLNSTLLPHPFLCKEYTRAVCLRFDGILLFGSWSIEWACQTLSHAGSGLSIEMLVIMIPDSPNRITIAYEDERAKALVNICYQTLRPQRISFIGQTCDPNESDHMRPEIGDKFSSIFGHFCQLASPPQLTSVDTNLIDHESTAWLIISNASTLTCLRVSSIRPSVIQKLVCDTVHNLVFPQLAELSLVLDLEDHSLQPFNIKFQHFPHLDQLRVTIPPEEISQDHETRLSIFEYSFLTDLFFHSSGCLRIVSFPLAWDAVEILTCKVLGQVQKLLFQEISMEGEHVLDEEESNQILSQILMLQHIQVVYLNSASLNTVLPPSLACTDLHTLIIPRYSLSADTLVQLLKQVPLLSVFHFRLGLGTSSDITGSTVVSSPIIADHTPLNRSMQVLVAIISSDIETSAVEKLFWILAMLPRLRKVALPAEHGDLLRDVIRQASGLCKYSWSADLAESLQIRHYSSSTG